MSIDEIKQLDITERILLVEEIWDSVTQEQEQVSLSQRKKVTKKLFCNAKPGKSGYAD